MGHCRGKKFGHCINTDGREVGAEDQGGTPNGKTKKNALLGSTKKKDKKLLKNCPLEINRKKEILGSSPDI